ncbi:MAG: hypothetical protein DRQ44_02750 [Gammaproteobacteria bacterium]|nr:MAG: hypothetical protein DRQ44_02750 [Gammaproteobacteria bacterium]
MYIMMIKNLILFTALLVLSAGISAQAKDENEEVYKLSYLEREPGIDEYEVTMLISARYIRVDEEGESSGFIIYDDKDKVIYSVSHHDESVLVIKEHVFTTDNLPVKPTIEYLPLADAPMVSGKAVFNYRVYIKESNSKAENESEETCIEVQLVENLLPEVRTILQNYQKVVSGQQVKMSDNKITEMQTACYYIDQIYNTGAYFEKGLPIQEWHSNERSKILTGYKKVTVHSDKFKIPQDYRQFSIEANSKTFIK